MKKIDKQHPPHQLTRYKRQVGANYDDMDKAVKDAVLISLLNEQGWVCAYCCQKISDKNATIEHFCERSICNGENGTKDKRLDYQNFLAVCPGKVGKQLHCDTKKATFSSHNGLPMKISPLSQAHMNAVSFSTTGLVKSLNPRHQQELDEILNLNVDFLKKLRERLIASFFRGAQDHDKSINHEKLKRILSRYLDFGNQRYTNSFPDVALYYLKKYA